MAAATESARAAMEEAAVAMAASMAMAAAMVVGEAAMVVEGRQRRARGRQALCYPQTRRRSAIAAAAEQRGRPAWSDQKCCIFASTRRQPRCHHRMPPGLQRLDCNALLVSMRERPSSAHALRSSRRAPRPPVTRLPPGRQRRVRAVHCHCLVLCERQETPWASCGSLRSCPPLGEDPAVAQWRRPTPADCATGRDLDPTTAAFPLLIQTPNQ
jgi:hypothetical protein